MEPVGQKGLGGEKQDKDKDKDKDKYRDKDKGKVKRGPNICYIFENQGVQGYQI